MTLPTSVNSNPCSIGSGRKRGTSVLRRGLQGQGVAEGMVELSRIEDFYHWHRLEWQHKVIVKRKPDCNQFYYFFKFSIANAIPASTWGGLLPLLYPLSVFGTPLPPGVLTDFWVTSHSAYSTLHVAEKMCMDLQSIWNHNVKDPIVLLKGL